MRYIDENQKKSRDFVRRRRLPTVVQYGLVFSGFYGLIIITFFATGSKLGFSAITLFWSGAIAAVITFAVQTSRDMVLATEYQNAIFSSAVSIDSLFTLIVREDGSIVYFDRGLQRIFPNFSRFSQRDLGIFLEIASVPEAHASSVFAAVYEMKPLRQLLSMVDGNGRSIQVVLAIEPIEYPAKFAVLRAREFVDRIAKPVVAEIGAHAPYVSFISQIAEKMPVGVLASDVNGAISYLNMNAEEWLGYKQEVLVQAQVALASIIRPKNYGFGIFHGEALITHKNNSVFSALIDISEIKNDDKVEGFVVIIYPPEKPVIATTKQIAVRDNNSLDDFIANAPIAIVTLDADGALSYVNRAFHVLTQNTLVDKLPRDIIDITVESKRAEASEQFKKILYSGAPKSPIALELMLPNNVQVSVSMYVSKLPSGEIALYLIDVSEQKNLEVRFAHSQKMQAVGQLAGGVAHDFNNLLTAMIGFCDLLLMRHPAGDQSFADIMQVKQNANRAANLVRQLLAFSRRQTLQPKMLDVTDVLAELSNLIRRLIGENIELKMVHGRNLGMIKADQGQLEQVIINLAVNARDAMSVGGGVLGIFTNVVSLKPGQSIPSEYLAPAGEDMTIPPGEYIVVEVNDTGTGIPPEVMQKIFEPFFSTKEVGSGTGLGLSTVYGIIKQTGGYIYVRSRVGEGTSFYIYFPHYQSGDVIAQTQAEAVSEKHLGDLTGAGTILLVEDETPVRAFAVRALRNKGYTVIEADCGETGLEIVSEHGSKIDLILTDVIMPGMNGPTMVDKILEQHKDIKVIFISGYAEDIFMNNYGSERSFNFLAKPFTLKQLASKVKEVITS